MKTLLVDVAVIGAGTAGLAAKAAGASAVLVEGGDHGTTCARVGCMPSKLLIAAIEAAHAVAKAPRFGIHGDGVIRVDGREVMDRVRREGDRLVGFVLREVQDFPEAERISCHARFADNHTIEVDDYNRAASKSIVIAAGSRPSPWIRILILAHDGSFPVGRRHVEFQHILLDNGRIHHAVWKAVSPLPLLAPAEQGDGLIVEAEDLRCAAAGYGPRNLD